MANGLGFAMPIALRTDFDALSVRSAARRSKDGAQTRRLLALAAIYDGARRTEAARIGGVTLQIVRDWVMKFNAAGPDGLLDRKAPGQPSLLNATHRAALDRGDRARSDTGFPRSGSLEDHRPGADALGRLLAVSVSRPTLSRELRALGYRKLSARPKTSRPGSRCDRGL